MGRLLVQWIVSILADELPRLETVHIKRCDETTHSIWVAVAENFMSEVCIDNLKLMENKHT
jgi:hypothetical protein